MNILNRLWKKTQPLPPMVSPIPMQESSRVCADQAALWLYRSVMPLGGLDWYELTTAQRQDFRDAIALARLITDKRPPQLRGSMTADDWLKHGLAQL